MLSCLVFGLSPTYAQTLDTEPPEVGIDPIEESDRTDNQIFTVTATDNQGIDSLTFFYRLDADSEYASGNMSRIGESDRFTFTVPAQSITSSANSIQYYIEARDNAGNRTLQGFSFDPVERLLVDRPASLASEQAADDTEDTSLLGSLSTTQKVAIGVVGLVVVGALVSSAGGGSESESSSSPMVPVTIVTDPLISFR